MPRLVRVDCAAPGFTRRRTGKRFGYADAGGNRITDDATLARIKGLRIPPAWTDVWICPHASGHIQATGVDAAGRRQYRYHDEWRLRRDGAKFERMLPFAAALPDMREQLLEHLAGKKLTRDRVLACGVRLLDLGFFRIGTESYAVRNQTFGLATMRREHVRVGRDGTIEFDYIAKSGKRRVVSMADEAVVRTVHQLKRRRGGGDELLAFQAGDRWADVKSHDINGYIRQLTGGDFTAKDFRTWNATVLAAVALAVSTEAPTTVTGRKRAVARAVQEVSHYLGNTPAVCRASYIDPRVIDLYDAGVTIHRDLKELGADASYGQLSTQGAIERAVLRMLTQSEAALARKAS
ncbi:MAG: DNA topoisomerase IB [Mycobacteriales bacterium]